MKYWIDKSFDRDVDRIQDKKVLKRVRDIISAIENARTIRGISHIKKIESFESYYRIKVGDYRLGNEVTSANEVILVRFLHRKEIYRYFPKRS